MLNELPSDADKAAVWEAYRARRPVRVPLRWNANPRIVLLDPALNPEGWGFEAYNRDPEVLMTVQARLLAYRAEVLGRTCDFACAPPSEWTFVVDSQNTYDAAYFGAAVSYEPGQVPATRPPFTLADVDDFLDETFPPPLENPWLRERLAFLAEIEKAAVAFTHLGRKGKVQPLGIGFDGPVTVAANLFDSDVFLLMAMDPDKARRLFEKITREAARRNRALAEHFGRSFPPEFGGLADDSIQLITVEMYEELVLPVHELWYQLTSTAPRAAGKRSMHLCGDATRHFPVIHERLGVTSFDTGFPVDHGRLREQLGPDVEISGGPRADLLLQGSPEACAESARQILTSGVMRGGRFILQEANNLPPCVPPANLAAVYEVCLEYGRYTRGTDDDRG